MVWGKLFFIYAEPASSPDFYASIKDKTIDSDSLTGHMERKWEIDDGEGTD